MTILLFVCMAIIIVSHASNRHIFVKLFRNSLRTPYIERKYFDCHDNLCRIVNVDFTEVAFRNESSLNINNVKVQVDYIQLNDVLYV